MNTRRDGGLSSVKDAIDKYMRGHGLIRAGRASQVPIVWSEVVGDWYCQHTEVLRVEHGVLTVRCDSAARAQQLSARQRGPRRPSRPFRDATLPACCRSMRRRPECCHL